MKSEIFNFRHLRYLFVSLFIALFVLAVLPTLAQTVHPDAKYSEAKDLQIKANGFKGIWYMNQPSNDEYVYKYSGGMATYTAKHQPLAIYSKKVNKTFFVFGGTDDRNSTLLHNISFFDHATGEVANPTSIIDKQTTDAHDNPVMSIDHKGYIWVFSTSHGTNRPSYIHKSNKPYDIEAFTRVNATEMVNGEEKPFDNFSYIQVWHVKGKGFMALYTKYEGWASRVIGFNTSKDGVKWNEWQVIAHIDAGHYEVSGEHNGKISLAFNYHPAGKGLNFRTNLYYLESKDFGKNWQTAEGEKVALPLTKPENPALIYDFKSDGLLCYVKDLNYDKNGNPIILVVSSKGYQPGPGNDPRTWEVFSYRKGWKNSKITRSGNNYDTGSIHVDPSGLWTVLGPTQMGPQAYNPGGEVAMWTSSNRGDSWVKVKQLTENSDKNHNYVRRPLNAHPGFMGVWADGHGRRPSESALYFSNIDGEVFQLPRHFTEPTVKPKERLPRNHDLESWPTGKSPQEIGLRVTRKYLNSGHSMYGNPKPANPPSQITYPDVCTWLGGLWFADITKNDDLYSDLTSRYTTLLATEKHLLPKPNHVDNNVFGALPLELFLKNGGDDHRDLGLFYADTQWGLPNGAKPHEKAWADKGYSWQTRIWIDDMFMITAVQAQAYRVTGKNEYVDRAAKEMVLYLDEIQLQNGLFYHSPEAKFSWGRGNGWMAVGMAEILRVLPVNNANYSRIMESYKKMMATLLNFQAKDGMWRQIVDDHESWKETSGTAMFTYAMITGVKNGWLDKKVYGAAARNSWVTLTDYINENDELTEVCAGTNIKNSREHYMTRPRIVGDLHGQAPLLWCAAALLRP